MLKQCNARKAPAGPGKISIHLIPLNTVTSFIFVGCIYKILKYLAAPQSLPVTQFRTWTQMVTLLNLVGTYHITCQSEHASSSAGNKTFQVPNRNFMVFG